MPSSSKVLDEARDLVKKRLSELDDERQRLERALAELGGKVAAGRRPGRPRGKNAKASAPLQPPKPKLRGPAAGVAAVGAPVPTRPFPWW